MICTSIERVNGTPTAVMPSLQIKSPALPGSCSCIQSISSVKFSYICAVRKTPVGTPEHKMYGTPSSPCLTVHVSLEQLTFTQPERSFPLKSMVGSGVGVVFGTKAIFRVWSGIANAFHPVINNKEQAKILNCIKDRLVGISRNCEVDTVQFSQLKSRSEFALVKKTHSDRLFLRELCFRVSNNPNSQ